MSSQTEWREDDIKLIDFMRANPQYVTNSYRNWGRSTLNDMWSNISKKLNIPESDCRINWNRIKTKYVNLLGKKEKPLKTKYFDGSLSFLNKYYLDRIKTVNSQVTPDVVVIDSDEESEEKDLYTLDLKIIEDLLVLRREPQEDFEIPGKDIILSLVSKRIDETLSTYHHQLKKPESLTDNEKAQDVEFQDLQDDETDFKSTLSYSDMRHAVCAFESTPLAKENFKIQLPVMKKSNDDDMETIFDINRNSDSKTFYQKLGNYTERFSKKTQEDIRLKICCLVAEIELEEL